MSWTVRSSSTETKVRATSSTFQTATIVDCISFPLLQLQEKKDCADSIQIARVEVKRVEPCFGYAKSTTQEAECRTAFIQRVKYRCYAEKELCERCPPESFLSLGTLRVQFRISSLTACYALSYATFVTSALLLKECECWQMLRVSTRVSSVVNPKQALGTSISS